MRINWKWAGSIALGASVSLFFLYLAVRRVDWGEVRGAAADVSIPVLALALVTRGLSFVAMALRSRTTVAPGGSVPFKDLALSHLLGFTGNNILPFRLGEILRLEYLSSRHGLPRSFLIGTIAVERLLDSLTLLALFALSVPTVLGIQALFSGTYVLFLAGAGGLVGLLVVGATWTRMPDIVGRTLQPLSTRLARGVGERTRHLSLGLRSLVSARLVTEALGATVLYWLFSSGSVAIFLAAFSLHLPWYAPFVVLAMTALGTALPAAPGFAGTFHYFSALGLSLMGVDRPTSISFAIVAHVMTFLPYTLFGLLVFSGSIPFWVRRAVALRAKGGLEA